MSNVYPAINSFTQNTVNPVYSTHGDDQKSTEMVQFIKTYPNHAYIIH